MCWRTEIGKSLHQNSKRTAEYTPANVNRGSLTKLARIWAAEAQDITLWENSDFPNLWQIQMINALYTGSLLWPRLLT